MWLKKPFIGETIISSPFDLHRIHPITKKEQPHKGIDLVMPKGTAIFAPIHGTIQCLDQGDNGYGKCVILNAVTEQGTRIQIRFAHLSEFLVKTGDCVSQFEKIALSGNTGLSTGAHLHFETRINEVPEDPTKYVDLA